jgi:hypothetical protein
MKLRLTVNVWFFTCSLFLVAPASALSSNALLTGNLPPCTPASSGLVSWWPADGNADDAIGGNNGTLAGNVTFAAGKVGQAFEFNGTDGYVQVGGSYSLTGARTIETWVFPSTNTDYGLPIIVGGPNGAGDYFGIAGTSGDCNVSQYNLYIDHFGTPCYNGGIAVTPNTWNHVAMVYDGTELQFFVNGVPGPVISGTLYDYDLNTCTIGGNLIDGSTTKPLFSGLIDEMSVYNRALTTNEIVSIYNAGAGGKCLNPTNLDHFVWNPIPSPRFVNKPFAVTIQAQNITNGLFTNFTGTAILGTTNGVAVTPPISGNFVQGVWTGTVVISQTASNLVLEADNGLGHFGLANPIDVLSLPQLGMLCSGNFALVIWPVEYSGFVLETSGSLSPAKWVLVPYAPIQYGDEYFLPLNMTGTNGFYRLYFPGP